MTVTHPAKFSEPILEALRPIVADLPGPILDPFAGTGRIHDLGRDDTVGVEIEPEWADMHERTVVANALDLPFAAESFGSVVTSCTYGNRMADPYAGDPSGSRRHTYRIGLGRPLHPANSGGMQWGKAYRDFHRKAWAECFRVLVPGGALVLNISDHIRKGVAVPVSAWHATTLIDVGFEGVREGWSTVDTPRNRHGANGDARVEFESIVRFYKPDLLAPFREDYGPSEVSE